jgi:hypothetical protein
VSPIFPLSLHHADPISDELLYDSTGIKWLPKVFAVLNSTSTTVAPIPSPTLKSSANSLVLGASVVLLSLGFSLVL